MTKKKKVLFAIIIVPFAIIAVPGIMLLMGFLLHCIIVLLGSYYGTNPSKLIERIETKYSVEFPSEISNAQAAKTASWENRTEFLMKFEMPSDDLETFLGNLGDVKRIIDYDQDHDDRKGNPNASPIKIPDWFYDPIKEGKIAWIPVTYRAKVGSALPFEIYIDTSMENKCVIYISGSLYNM